MIGTCLATVCQTQSHAMILQKFEKYGKIYNLKKNKNAVKYRQRLNSAVVRPVVAFCTTNNT